MMEFDQISGYSGLAKLIHTFNHHATLERQDLEKGVSNL